MNVAAIDIGTNSVRLLITDARGGELVREMEITRLGQGVDKARALGRDAIARTLSVLARYASSLRAHGIDTSPRARGTIATEPAPGIDTSPRAAARETGQRSRIRITATSAARDASNREAFFQEVEKLFGQPPELLSGEDEAKLSFSGATQGIDTQEGPFLIFDIGGGSTEFAFGTHQPESFISVDMGGVRVTERFLSSDPPTPEEMSTARSFVCDQLERVARVVPTAQARTWVGLAGTVTSCAAYVLGLDTYDPERTHGFSLRPEHAERFLQELSRVPIVARRALLLEPKRAEVIVGGAIVFDAIFEHFQLSEVRVSERDILDGLAASLR